MFFNSIQEYNGIFFTIRTITHIILLRVHLLNSHLEVYVLRKWPKNLNIKLLASNPYKILFLPLITIFPTSYIKEQKSQYILSKG